MFKFYVGLAGQEKVSDNSRTTMCKRNIKAHHWIQKVQKTKDIQKAWVLMGKQFEDFRQKKNRNIILDLSKKPNETHGREIQQLNMALANSKN